jgi:hypothetical protein
MAKKSVSKLKRKPGRPAGRVQDTPMHFRASADFIEALDNWCNQQPDRPSRSDGLRRLTTLALEAEAAALKKKRK